MTFPIFLFFPNVVVDPADKHESMQVLQKIFSQHCLVIASNHAGCTCVPTMHDEGGCHRITCILRSF